VDSTPDHPQPERPPFLERPAGQVVARTVIALLAVGTAAYGYFYFTLSREVDRRLATGAFADTVNIYSAPRTVVVGDPLTRAEVVQRLRRSGYGLSRSNPLGWYNERENAVEIFPGPSSYLGSEPAVLYFSGAKLARIVSLQDNTERQEYLLEPQLLTNLSENREKRRLVRFADIPETLIHAVVSAEDKRFFQHNGVDVFRIVKAAYVDVKEGRKEQGASTLSMQLARALWLEPEKRWVRKAKELVITLHLEEKLSKQQIFEDYANEVYLGRRGPFSINGFGEGARVYFDKDISQLDIAEAALLAGLVQRPSSYNPYRYPDRARERRNLVLMLMRDNGYLSDEQYRQAVAAPVALAPERSEGLETSYFLDAMNEELQTRLDDHEKSARYIYTSLDPELQSAAEAAVRMGMENVDQQLRRRKRREGIPPGQPQVALVALDPHTGEVKALVGGRNYGASQLNHALAMRQPGSVFKPFVYAAALDTAVSSGPHIFTPASTLDDSPTTFHFAGQTYTPDNFDHEFMGQVTLRTALAHSLNVATIKLAQEIGYANVVALARRAGLHDPIQPTPAVALGAYETTPLEIAGAYTMFANSGRRLTPSLVSLVRTRDGAVLYEHQPDPVAALDPRVNYLMVSMLEEVLRSGTGAGVRERGFTLPAAGKTGTSRDGWFAGFTSELLCVVWVGFDDNRDLNLEGAQSALPIWTGFMKRAAQLRPYRDAKPFPEPDGIVSVRICEDSGQLAGDNCPRTRSDLFIQGTQPAIECQLHSLQPSTIGADRVSDFQPAAPAAAAPAPTAPAASPQRTTAPLATPPPAATPRATVSK
jgi:penicillin-binding protein 1B